MANKVSNPKMFNASWQEKDDAILTELLHTKIVELKWEIKMASSPYVARQLKVKRKEYKEMLKKVSLGQYDGNIIMNDLVSASRYQNVEKEKKEKVLSKYVNSYSEIDFDYQSYFSRTRYFGKSLPLLMILITAILFFTMMMGFIMPTQTKSINTTLAEYVDTMWIDLSTVAYLKVGNGYTDYSIPNDGNWPTGKYKDGFKPLKQGDVFIDGRGNVPSNVLVSDQLGFIALNISYVDVLKGFFKMPLVLKGDRINFIEDLAVMQGTSWFYQGFMRDSSSLEIKKGTDGKYDTATIIRNIATYGTIICLLLALLFAIISILKGIIRLFSYTTKKLDFTLLLTFIFGGLSVFLPAFAKLQSIDDVGDAFGSYFTFGSELFLENTNTYVSVNLISLLLLALPLIAMFLPLVFRNRVKYQISHVPKGNKPPKDPSLSPRNLKVNQSSIKTTKGKSKKGKTMVSQKGQNMPNSQNPYSPGYPINGQYPMPLQQNVNPSINGNYNKQPRR